VTSALAKFRPTRVAAGWPAATTAERYPKYLAGTLPPSRNEVVQLGFRLAKLAGLKAVNGIDADGDFPYLELKAYAQAHGQSGLLEAQDPAIEGFTPCSMDMGTRSSCGSAWRRRRASSWSSRSIICRNSAKQPDS